MYISADCVADLADDGNLDAADGHLDPTSPSADGAAEDTNDLTHNTLLICFLAMTADCHHDGTQDDDLLLTAKPPSLMMMLTDQPPSRLELIH